MDDKERIARLPKWAQSRIGVLERDLEQARNELHHAIGTKVSRCWVEIGPWQMGKPERRAYIEGERVTFGAENWEISVRLNEKSDSLVLNGNGGRGLAVYPNSSNDINVKVIKER